MTALQTNQVTLPREVATAIIKEAHKTSAIASLATPDKTGLYEDSYNVFTGKARGHIVAEGEKKQGYDQTVAPIEGTLVTVQTTTRVSKQLQWADSDNQLEILDAIQADQSGAVGETLDYAIFHGIDPLSGGRVAKLTAPLADVGQQVTAGKDALADIDALTDKLIKWRINGFALDPVFAQTLRKLRVSANGARLFPEIPLNLAAGSVDGIPAVVAQSVGGAYATQETKVLGFMGEFEGNIRWRLARPITAEIIPYGDPDNTGVDLAGSNQIAYRTEAVFSFAVINANAIAVLKAA